jgi:predicted enzyme related to lactoylglutathione lyase
MITHMPTIVHFEIPADDIERARKFYTDLFGWKIEKICIVVLLPIMIVT